MGWSPDTGLPAPFAARWGSMSVLLWLRRQGEKLLILEEEGLGQSFWHVCLPTHHSRWAPWRQCDVGLWLGAAAGLFPMLLWAFRCLYEQSMPGTAGASACCHTPLAPAVTPVCELTRLHEGLMGVGGARCGDCGSVLPSPPALSGTQVLVLCTLWSNWKVCGS